MPEELNKSEIARFNASSEEELDALELNLSQDDDDIRDTADGTGRINDDVARDQIEGMTEVGSELVDKGVDVVVPGRDDTSATLRRHQTNFGDGSDSVVEGNMDEPRDESLMDRSVDEDTAA